MTARPPSLGSNAPRGADSRYTTERSRSGVSRAAEVPRSAITGRRSTGVAARRISTRPRIGPGREAGTRPGDTGTALTCGTKDTALTRGTKDTALRRGTKDTKATKVTKDTKANAAQHSVTQRFTLCVLCTLC